jgi:hypothetical protein
MTSRKYNDGNTSTYTVMVAMLLLILAMLCGCNETKKLEKAEQRVKLNKASFDNIGKAWAAINFQPPEVLPPVILKGKTEYVPIEKLVELPVFDSFMFQQKVDSIKNEYQGKCNEAVDKAFKAGAKAMLKELSQKNVLHQLPDTALYTTVDKKYIKFLEDSVNGESRKIAHLSGQYTQQAQTLAATEKRATNLLIWLLSLCVAIVVGIVLWIVIKIRPI